MTDSIIDPPVAEGNPFVDALTWRPDAEDAAESPPEPPSAAPAYTPAKGPQDPENPFGVPPWRLEDIRDIEGSFWAATPELALIAKTAGEELASPWGLLGALLAFAATHIPYRVELPRRSGRYPTRVGDGGSLNTCVALSGESGQAKSNLLSAAAMLLPPNGQMATGGTSQAWIKKLVENRTVGRGEEKTVQRVRLGDTLLVKVDEIDSLTSEFARTGSKTSAAIRELLMGQFTGSATVDETRNNYLLAGSYRFALLFGAQGDRCAPVFTPAEIAGGTPQRMLFLPVAFDGLREGVNAIAAAALPPPPTWPKVPHANGQFATSLAGPVSSSEEAGQPAEELDLPVTIPWAPAAAKEMTRRAKAAQPQEAFPTIGMSDVELKKHQAVVIRRHLMLLRFKVAALLAALHGRTAPTDLDWGLSYTVIRVHLGQLAGIVTVLGDITKAEARERGKALGVASFAADAAKTDERDKAVARVANKIFADLVKNGQSSEGTLRRGVAARDRALFPAALMRLRDTGRAEQVIPGGTTWVALIEGRRIARGGQVAVQNVA